MLALSHLLRRVAPGFLLAALAWAAPASSAQPLELLFVYGSEKQPWVDDVSAAFNAGDFRTAAGRKISVRTVPMGSGEAAQAILSGRTQAHLFSPASAAYVELANAESKDKTGIDLIGETHSLVLSPVVIAMWKPMAEALGWGKKPIGWADILALANDPGGWGAYGHPDWGHFRFGHTHPYHSNSGLISLLAEVYAATEKTRGLTVEDVERAETRRFVQSIERSVVHYGRSTGFFGRKLTEACRTYLSAAVLYENMVIEANDPQRHAPQPLVAIYPKEGTFWSDHPVGIVEREWVSPEHREAARIYVDYLLAKPQQQKAMRYGFRPADVDIALGTPFDAAHGVDPAQPKTTLQVPSAKVMQAILGLWKQEKKHADIVLVLDTSGSMRGEKLQKAKEGALRLISALGEQDRLSVLAFSSRLSWLAQGESVGEGRKAVEDKVRGLSAAGGTALYDAIEAAYRYLKASPLRDHIDAVVVLTDGADTNSRTKLESLLGIIPVGPGSEVCIFPIAYGRDANQAVLSRIAQTTQVQSFQGKPEDIDKVFQEISTFL
jgi:Ca-activated chloride channel family protein